jgi:hypothetical protein
MDHQDLLKNRPRPVATRFEVAAVRMADAWLQAGRVDVTPDDLAIASSSKAPGPPSAPPVGRCCASAIATAAPRRSPARRWSSSPSAASRSARAATTTRRAEARAVYESRRNAHTSWWSSQPRGMKAIRRAGRPRMAAAMNASEWNATPQSGSRS